MEKRKNQSKNKIYQKQINNTQHTPEKAITNGRVFVFLIKKIFKLWIKREKISGKHTKVNINYQ